MQKIINALCTAFLLLVIGSVIWGFTFAQDAKGLKLPLEPRDRVVEQASVRLVCPTEEGLLNLLDNYSYWVQNSPDGQPPHDCVWFGPGIFLGPYVPQFRYQDAEGDHAIIYLAEDAFWTFDFIEVGDPV